MINHAHSAHQPAAKSYNVIRKAKNKTNLSFFSLHRYHSFERETLARTLLHVRSSTSATTDSEPWLLLWPLTTHKITQLKILNYLFLHSIFVLVNKTNIWMIVRRPLETARCYFVFVPSIQSWFVLFCFLPRRLACNHSVRVRFTLLCIFNE